MTSRSRWSYAQARLQARHGERLQEGDWRVLEAARSVDQFIERARATSLRRFTEQLTARMSSHAMERLLRAAWRTYVAEVAAWVETDWRPLVLWTSHLPDLPAIAALRAGEMADWVRHDPVFSELVDDDPGRRVEKLEQSPFAPLFAPAAPEQSPGRRWYVHWRSLLPPGRQADERPLIKLAELVQTHVEQLRHASPQEGSGRYRRDLAQNLTRLFRRHGGSPVALFCHLGLVALDLERLRGGLVRRRLFEPGHAKEVA
jgi:hypothetical protein